MATLTLQSIVGTGLVPSYSAATGGGDAMPVGQANFLHVKNGGGSPITVTVAAVASCSQGSTHNLAPSVANGSERMIGPISSRYADGSTGLAVITYSAVTSVTVAAVKIDPQAV